MVVSCWKGPFVRRHPRAAPCRPHSAVLLGARPPGSGCVAPARRDTAAMASSRTDHAGASSHRPGWWPQTEQLVARPDSAERVEQLEGSDRDGDRHRPPRLPRHRQSVHSSRAGVAARSPTSSVARRSRPGTVAMLSCTRVGAGSRRCMNGPVHRGHAPPLASSHPHKNVAAPGPGRSWRIATRQQCRRCRRGGVRVHNGDGMAERSRMAPRGALDHGQPSDPFDLKRP